MNRLLVSAAVAGVALTLSACVYYPDGPYGPGYGPYHRPTYDSPPPQENYGPPRSQQQSYGPPPSQGNYGPDDEQSYAQQNGPGNQYEGSSGSSIDKKIAHMNNPKWCSKHQQKCDRLRAKYNQGEQGPSDSDQEPEPVQ